MPNTVDNPMRERQIVLIADDSEMNRALLIEMLENAFDIIEAEDGRQAVEVLSTKRVDMLLLDLMMPEMDGFEVLAYMNRCGWIEDIPVIIISAETAPASIQRAYDLGVTDFISRPFDAAIVRRRVQNTLLLSAKQQKLASIVAEQLYEKQKSNRLMVNVLSHIVEFRNGESGAHVLHINAITEMFLQYLSDKYPEYNLTPDSIESIVLASSLHDVGKIAIASEVLNKPGRLTPEEFEVIKTHTVIGAEMLSNLPEEQRNEPLIQMAYGICRWHHERYDGRGYPDGLKGEEIPISAQVVALADVYDALTSERCYKKAIPHEKAVEMILDGQCGTFNPRLMECLKALSEKLAAELRTESSANHETEDMHRVAEQMVQYDQPYLERLLCRLEAEREKTDFLMTWTGDIFFTYTVTPPLLTLNGSGTEAIGTETVCEDALKNGTAPAGVDSAAWEALRTRLKAATPAQPDVEGVLKLEKDGVRQQCRVICRTIWPSETAETYSGVIGKLADFKKLEA